MVKYYSNIMGCQLEKHNTFSDMLDHYRKNYPDMMKEGISEIHVYTSEIDIRSVYLKADLYPVMIDYEDFIATIDEKIRYTLGKKESDKKDITEKGWITIYSNRYEWD